MENKVEKIDIEKNKELFEYEMTEVILKLKGEFAAFSGKGTKFAEILVDDAKLHISSPKVVQVEVKDYHVESPKIGSIQKTKKVYAEVKKTTLQLPIIPKISDEDGKKEKNTFSTKKANVCQEIIISSIPLLNWAALSRCFPEISLKDEKKEIISSAEVPSLESILESAQKLKSEAHIAPILVHVPRTIKYSDWNKSQASMRYKNRIRQKSVLYGQYDSSRKTSQVESLSKVQVVNCTDIKVPHIETNMTLGIEDRKKAWSYRIDVPHINRTEGCLHRISTITREFVQIEVPTTSSFDYCGSKKNTFVTNKKKSVCIGNAQIRVVLPKTRTPKYPKEKLNVASEWGALQTPDMSVIKKRDFPIVRRIDIEIPLLHKMVKNIDGIRTFDSSINATNLFVPTISFEKVAKYVIDVPTMSESHFSCLAQVEQTKAVNKFEVFPINVDSNLEKVTISYHGTIVTTQKPEVKETVNHIIALAAVKR